MKKKKLVIITRNYPIGTEEFSFLPQELEVLDKYFDILLVPKYTIEELDADNCKYPIIKCNCNLTLPQKLLYTLLSILDFRFWKEIYRFIEKKSLSSTLIRQILADLMMSQNLDQVIRPIISNAGIGEDIIFYSYWFDYTLLSLTKSKKDNIKVVTRTHGFDLYNERCLSGFQCFKEQMDKKIDHVIFVSLFGKKYYCREFAQTEEKNTKYVVNYLGVKHQKFIPYQKHDVFSIISCSSVIPIKRVDKIIEALSQIDEFSVEWIHIGDGNNFDKIKLYAEKLLRNKENIKYTLMGNLPNENVMEIYRSNYFDCFILLSETEGLPVCIMEAMSFGIPVISNDVGGICEIVNEKNGYLLPTYKNEQKIAQTMKEIQFLKEQEKIELRKNAYATWENSFDSNENAENLAKILDDKM